MKLLKLSIWMLCAVALSLATGVCRAANDVIPITEAITAVAIAVIVFFIKSNPFKKK